MEVCISNKNPGSECKNLVEKMPGQFEDINKMWTEFSQNTDAQRVQNTISYFHESLT